MAGPVTLEIAGAIPSTSTPVVSGGVKVSTAALPAASLIVPAFKLSDDANAMPSLSLSPLAIV